MHPLVERLGGARVGLAARVGLQAQLHEELTYRTREGVALDAEGRALPVGALLAAEEAGGRVPLWAAQRAAAQLVRVHAPAHALQDDAGTRCGEAGGGDSITF